MDVIALLRFFTGSEKVQKSNFDWVIVYLFTGSGTFRMDPVYELFAEIEKNTFFLGAGDIEVKNPSINKNK